MRTGETAVSYTHLGAMIEPLAVAVHGVKQMGDVAGMNIAVLGAGPIGNLVAQTAIGMGAAKVMITDCLLYTSVSSENFRPVGRNSDQIP